MKIGILTFWWSYDNYGQILQAWALQRQLKIMGHTPYLIRYSEYDKSKTGLKLRLINLLKKNPVLGFLYNTIKNEKYYRVLCHNRQRGFDGFRKQYFAFSSLYYSSLHDIQAAPPAADAYIVGSDQVWAHLLNIDYNSIYFLNFGNISVKRLSYAPSFGMDKYPDHLKRNLKEALNRFDAISVREQQGVEICKSVGVDAKRVVDPTILIDISEYQSLFDDNNVCSSPYIFVYCVNINSPEQIKWTDLNIFSKEYEFEVKTTTASGYLSANEIFEGADYEYSTIPQWLSNISHAQMVVTTSFHAVVFSLLFHTKFVFFPIEGKFGRGNSRVTDLLGRLSLTDFIWSELQDFDFYFRHEIDWNRIDVLFDKERKESLRFLNESLSK